MGEGNDVERTTEHNATTSDRVAVSRSVQWALVCVSTLCSAPLWVSDFLPFQDLPQHLAAVRTIHDLDDPTLRLSVFHVVDLSRTQYLSWYLVMDLLCYLMPLTVACRLLLTAYVWAVPWSAYFLLRATRRETSYALLAAPLALNTFLYMGFANYVVALPMVLAATAMLTRSFERWSPSYAALHGALVLLLFYSHVQALLMYLGFAGLTVMVLTPSWHPRRWYKQTLHALPTVALLVRWVYQSRILATGKAWAEGHGGRNTTDAKVHFEPLLDRFKAVPGQLLEVFRDDTDEWLLLTWLAALAVAALLGGQRSPTASEHAAEQGLRSRWRDRLPVIWLIAGVAVYLLSPISYKWIWPISHRLVPLLGMIAVVAFARQRLWVHRGWIIAPAVCLCAWTAWLHIDHARSFDQEAGPVEAVLARAEPGKRLVGLIFDKHSAVTNGAPYLHFAQYYVVSKGGMANFSFANMPQSPVVYPDVGGPPTLRPRWEWLPHLFSWSREGTFYDYVLMRGGRAHAARLVKQSKGALVKVASQGRWSLYKHARAQASEARP